MRLILRKYYGMTLGSFPSTASHVRSLFLDFRLLPFNNSIENAKSPFLFLTFKAIKFYLLPSQKSFGPVRHLAEHMLALISFESVYLKQHLRTLIVYGPTQSTHVFVKPISDKGKAVSSGGKKKKSAKRKYSPSNPKSRNRSKVDSSSQ